MESTLMTFLSPMLGFLIRSGDDAAGRAVEAVGSAAWERAQAIWSKLWPTVKGDEQAKLAVEAVAENSEDEAAKGALQFRLRTLLATDPALADELSRILDEARNDGVIADNGAVIIHGGLHADRGGVAAGRDIKGDIRTSRS